MLDFRDWKKTAEDKHGVTMQHPKGHKMTILFKGVPMIQREALKHLPMAEGGEIKKSDKNIKGVNKQSVMSESSGTSAAGAAVRRGRTALAEDHHANTLKEMKKINPKLKGLADGGEVGDDDDDSTPNNTTPAPTDVAAPASQLGPVNVQQPNINQGNPPVLLPNGSMSAPGAAQTGQEGLQSQEKVDIASAKAKADAEQAYIQQQQKIAQQQQDNINDLSQHANDFAQNIHNINPQQYMQQMAAPEKVATALGLIAGGFTQGVTHGAVGNTALTWLNSQIDRDVDAQKQNNQNQKTIYGAYEQLYGDQNIATNMAKASMADIYTHQLGQIAAKLGTPQAIANYQKGAADLAVTRNKSIMDSAGNLNSIPNNPANGNPLTSNNTGQGPAIGYDVNGKPVYSSTATGGLQQNAEANNPSNENLNVLNPNAESKINDLQYGTPQQRSDYPEAQKQLGDAQQIQKAMTNIKSLFPRLRSEANISGNIASHISPNALGATFAVPGAVLGAGGLGAISGGTAALPGAIGGATVGGAFGEGLGHAAKGVLTATGGNKEIQYQNDKAALSKFLINALGNNATGQEIDDIVEKATPGYWDDEKSYSQKLENIMKFMISKAKTNLLTKYKAAPDRE